MNEIYHLPTGVYRLTKYQTSKVSELMCPICNGELTRVFQQVNHCGSCDISFVGSRHVPAS